MKKLFVVVLLITFQSNCLHAQVKFEREYRLDTKEVPELALDFVNALNFNSRIKWYKEEGFNSTSIEAKTKYQGKRYSIEFNNGGVFEDVEIGVSVKDIPTTTRVKIQEHLKAKFIKYKIRKAQIQYLGKPDDILSFLKNESSKDRLTINFELIVSAKVDKTYKKYEFLFAHDGGYIQHVEVVLTNHDNIEY